MLEDLERVVAGGAKGEPVGCLVNLESRGEAPPLIFVHEISGALLAYRHLVEALGCLPSFDLQRACQTGSLRQRSWTSVEP